MRYIFHTILVIILAISCNTKGGKNNNIEQLQILENNNIDSFVYNTCRLNLINFILKNYKDSDSIVTIIKGFPIFVECFSNREYGGLLDEASFCKNINVIFDAHTIKQIEQYKSIINGNKDLDVVIEYKQNGFEKSRNFKFKFNTDDKKYYLVSIICAG
ncbi:MAG: hypothetical protein IPM95_00100 [Sphingobacteriales bacterium]|nr:hypothetical protein [Sphingobacteriales bacterium]